MARLNNRPSDNPRARFASETPDPASGQENRDPTSMASRAKGKGPASRPNSRPNSRATSLSGVSTTSSIEDSNASRQNKRKRGERPGTIDEEEEKDDEFYKYFDPNQNAEERRRVKRQSRALERDFQEKRDDYLNNEGDDLTKTVLKANDIFKGIKQTGDATSDSRLLVNVSDLGNKKASRLGHGDSSLRVDLDELVSKCITFMRNRGALNNQDAVRPSASRNRRATQRAKDDDDDDDEDDENVGEPLDWAYFGQNACFPYTSRPPLPNFLLGPLSVQKKARAATQRRARNAKDSQAREARPETMTNDDMSATEDSGLVKICINIHDVLQSHCLEAERALEAAGVSNLDDLKTDQGKQLLKQNRITLEGWVPLFEFVINPHSFGQTVENLFYVSFLIKEGKVGVKFDEDGLPTVASISKKDDEERKAKLREEGKPAPHAHQAILEMDYTIWEKLVQAYGIKKPIIPHRKEAETQIGQRGWYT